MIKDFFEFFSFLNPFKDWRTILAPRNLFLNYFWIITITAVLNHVVGIGWFSTVLLPIVIYICVAQQSSRIRFNSMDVMWFVMFVWMVFTWTYNDYPNKGILVIRCIASQIAYMMTYWIARHAKADVIQTIIKKSYAPLVLTAIIGIYCFFFRPSWYVHIIEEYLNNREGVITENRYLEAFRLRSIFPSPYTLAYFCAITLTYEFFLIIRDRLKRRNLHYIFIALLAVTMILAMMRAPLVSAIVGLIFAIVYGYYYLKTSRTILIISSVFIIGAVSIPVILTNMSKSSNNYLISKIEAVTDNTEEFVTYRLYLDQRGSELIGDGVGRHSMHADKYNPGTSIRDGEYMKIIMEQGYIGLGIFIMIITMALYNCLLNFKYLPLELCLLLMLLICMIGANPLSTGDKHPIFYWLALGRISKLCNKNAIYNS